MADEVLLRDEISYEIAKKLIGKNKKIKVIGDPAIISIENYRNQYKSYREDYVAINFREYTSSEYGSNCYYDIEFARKVVNTIRNKFEKVLLVPMHTFAIGGDDRKHLSEIVFNQNYDNAYVLHEPMNIYELYKIYLNAKACIGMRYHSIVMQTILNGNNFILDYTNVKTGKINGFINMLKNNKFYGDRIIHLQQPITKDKYELLHNICLNERYDYVNSNINKDYIDIMLPYVKGESFVKNEE
jgi:polysaccharide pyruvyl transferase WcaK-like protein